jgi:uncharacterized DUF497 family protein
MLMAFLLSWRRPYSETRSPLSGLTIAKIMAFVIVGMAEGQVLLFVAYTERKERIRIISARRATQHEQDDYFKQNA